MAERCLPVGLLACMLAAACSQLLGIDDLGYHPDSGGMSDAPTADVIVVPDAPPDSPCGSSRDPSNCGVCGHDCLGGACVAGVCQPGTVYVSSASLEAELATDDTNIFFRSATQVLSCPATQPSCSPGLVQNTNAPPPRFLAAALGHVYWNDSNVIYGCATTSPCNATQYLSTTPATLDGIGSAVHSTYLYAVDQDNTQNPPPIRVWVMGLDDAAPNPTQVINYTSGGPAAPNQVAATPTSTSVFWSQLTSPTLYECSSGSPAYCGSTPDGDTTAGTSPLALVATPAQLYVATTYGVRSVLPALTGAPAPFAGTSQVLAMAANPESTQLFYADVAGAAEDIAQCSTSVTPCTPNILATRSSAISAMAADETAVYWIEGGNTIMRLVL